VTGPSPDAIARVWALSLVIYAVVLVVVAILLFLILREAKRIHAGASEIWNVGQKIANNTIHIALLGVTNHVAGRILKSAGVVAGATAALRAHAESCPGCPHCILGSR
jgi:hypothetical protein